MPPKKSLEAIFQSVFDEDNNRLKIGVVANDDAAITFGTGGTVSLLWETADANANALTLVFPEGDGTDVPVLIIGDASISNQDLGWFNAQTEPRLAIVNDAKDAYVALDAGDDAVATSMGLYFKAAADEDVELINLSVTGTPRMFWDESEDKFAMSKGLTIEGAFWLNSTQFILNSTGSIDAGWGDAEYITFRARDTGVGMVEVMRLVGAADAYVQMTLAMRLNPIATASLPATPVEGMVAYDDTANKIKFYNGAAWETVTSAVI